MDQQYQFVHKITEQLELAGIPYMITGSMALALFTTPRMTRDVDIVIECSSQDAETIIKTFQPDCYISPENIRDAIAKHGIFNIISNEFLVKADFIVRKDTPYRKIEFDRRRRYNLEGKPVWVVSPEDLILSKLFWSKDSNSELQQRDVSSIIHSIPNLDWAYIEKWAVILEIEELLKKVKN